MQPDDQPIYTWTDGVVYVTGFRRRLPWRGLAATVDLGSYLHRLGRLIQQQTGITSFDIDAPPDPTQPGAIVITIRHAPRPYGRRPRGQRAGKAHRVPTDPELNAT